MACHCHIGANAMILYLCRIAGVEEEEVFQRFSQQVTDESLKPFMSIKKKHETADEWKSYVELCISGEAIQRVEKFPEAGLDVHTILGNHMEIPKGAFIHPLHAAVFSIDVRYRVSSSY
jgi:hypothetical protein